MMEEELSDSETDENRENTSSDEFENRSNGGDEEGINGYEKQRLLRIKENRARMEAFGLPKLASSLLRSVEKQPKLLKGKGKKEEDDEYRPSDVDDVLSSSSEEDKEEEDWDAGDDRSSGSRRALVKNKKSMGKAKKKIFLQKHLNESDFIDDDGALRQAIALSLQESADVSDVMHCGPSQTSDAHLVDEVVNGRKKRSYIQEDVKRKRKKPNTSRVQMTEDEVILHFFQFDEAGKGNITLRDLQRVATAHDFGWTDKEMADMIDSFDSDRDGKLSLEDFRNIVCRCHMIQRYEK